MFAIKTDLIAISSLFYTPHYLSLTFEKGFHKKHAVQLTSLYAWYSSDYEIDRTIQLVPQYKYYFNGVNKGFFAGLYFKYERDHRKIYEQYDDSNNMLTPLDPRETLEREYIEKNIGLGIIVGYQRALTKHWLVEIIPGIGVKKTESFETIVWDSAPVPLNDYGMDVMLALNVGYKF